METGRPPRAGSSGGRHNGNRSSSSSSGSRCSGSSSRRAGTPRALSIRCVLSSVHASARVLIRPDAVTEHAPRRWQGVNRLQMYPGSQFDMMLRQGAEQQSLALPQVRQFFLEGMRPDQDYASMRSRLPQPQPQIQKT